MNWYNQLLLTWFFALCIASSWLNYVWYYRSQSDFNSSRQINFSAHVLILIRVISLQPKGEYFHSSLSMFVRQTSTSYDCFLMLHCFPSLHSAYLFLVSFQTAKCVLPCTAPALLTVSSLKDIHLFRRLAPMSSELYWNMQPDFAPLLILHPP